MKRKPKPAKAKSKPQLQVKLIPVDGMDYHVIAVRVKGAK